MGEDSLTQLLTICLAISIFILLVLIVVYIVVAKKDKQRKQDKTKEKDILVKKEDKKDESKKKVASNSVQTKVYTTENIKNFMDFTEIKDNMIVQKDGKRLVMVIQCQGVNYDLMSAIEKTGVEQGFSQFLNTLQKPIQLYIQARKVNLEDSIAEFKKRLEIIENNFNKISVKYEQAQKKIEPSDKRFKNIKMEYVRQKNLYEYTKDIIMNTERLSLNQNILTKNYYIAIYHHPENSDNLFQKEELMEMAFSELYTNAQAILRTLSVCGVSGKVLNSVELADLLYVAYNRDASEIYDVDKAIKSGYDALYTTAPDVITKRIEELDRIIDKKAFDLANDTINKVTFKNRREKELEEKEQNMEDIIKEMAKSMIMDTEGYISEEIIEQSVEEIDNQDKKRKTTRKMKKGA